MLSSNELNNIYNLTNKQLLAPSELVDNLDILGYEDISYKKVGGNLVCNLRFHEGEYECNFKYFFDENKFLSRIICVDDKNVTELFNRELELTEKLNRFDKFQEPLSQKKA
ncbi:hypothetical protein [Liquorilactobacillus uvarum]|uniref:hypothetical protein n=1 Tax=Liquorilactobacillus uvarum TaxID=303240 RepID=UPI00288A2CD3|nr:hypothetical protein [Liquorilactobacillus uvarum]